MSENDNKTLLVLAEAKLRIAGCGMLVAAFLGAWLLFGQNGAQQEQNLAWCGVVGGPETVKVDSTKLMLLRDYFGHHLDIHRGEKLFKGNCSACHKLDRDMSGPMIIGILQSAPQPSLDWLQAFLLREDSLIAVEDPFTLALRQAWQAPDNWSHRLVGLEPYEAAEVVAYIAMHELVLEGGWYSALTERMPK